MDEIARRVFVKGASFGALAFMVGGVEVLLTPKEARAQGVAFRMLKPEEVETLEAVGETLAIGARASRHRPLRRPAGLDRAELRPADAAGERRTSALCQLLSRRAWRRGPREPQRCIGRRYAELTAAEQHDFVDRLRQNKLENWQGPRRRRSI